MSDYSLSDIAAVTDGVGGNRGNGGWGSDGWWIILLFILLGGWNGNRGFGNGNAGGDVLYPWLNQAQLTTQGFADQNAVMALNGIQGGIQGLSTQLCNCCSDIQMALANGFAGVEQGANARQMANMNQLFGMQTAMTQGFMGQQMQLAGLGADIAREACADRQAVSDGVRDILAGQVAGTQAIMDKLCQLELDGVKNQLAQEQRENANLREQVSRADFAASQAAQNAFISQGFANEVDALYNRLNTCPVPTTPVYGRTPIFTCQNNGCPCNG
jgi:hypothetical protein